MTKYLKLLIAIFILCLSVVGCSTVNQVSIEQTNHNGNSLLHTATRNNSFEVIKQLISMGANVNAKNSDGLTPLIIASQENNLKSAQLLLNANANVNLKDNKKYSALFYAINAYSELTSSFTMSKDNPNYSVDWRVGSAELVKKLINKGAYLNYPEYIPLEDDGFSKEVRLKCAVTKVKIIQLEMPCQEHINISFDRNDSKSASIVKSIFDSCHAVKKKLIPPYEQLLEDNCAGLY